jgi:hypothetical protein
MCLDEIPKGVASGYEVLVDTGAYVLGGGETWCPVRKIGGGTFPVVVTLPEVGKASFRANEILDVRSAAVQ